MTKIFVEVDSKSGVRKTTSKVTSVSEANEAGRLSAAIAFSLSLVNDAALESAGLPATNIEFKQNIWVPRLIDEELGADHFEQIELGLAEAPRPLDDDPADWIVPAIKKAYPNHYAWASVGQSYSFTKPAKPAETSPLGVDYETEPEKSLELPPESEVDVALHILVNTHGICGRPEDRFIDGYCGWVEDDRKGTVFVTDLYEADETVIAAIQNFVYETNLRFSLNGKSEKYPSRTLRLAIWKV